MGEQAVIVKFEYLADTLEPLQALEDELAHAIECAEVGEFDGNEIAVDLSDGTLFMYGFDADALFAVVRPLLVVAECLRNTRVTLRYGPPEDGVREQIVSLNA